jgi:hypothetical protein
MALYRIDTEVFLWDTDSFLKHLLHEIHTSNCWQTAVACGTSESARNRRVSKLWTPDHFARGFKVSELTTPEGHEGTELATLRKE